MRSFRVSEENYIREHYGKTPLSEIAKHLGRRKSTIVQHLKLMGLKLTDEQRKAIHNANKFQPGHVPFNKGTRGVMKPNATTFKAGQLPHNTKEDGAISIRQKEGDKPYKFIRIAKAKWVLLHRHVWQQANGPIPAGHLIAFIDGDTMNCELDNLQMITMAENVKRNQNRPKAAESIKHRWKVKRAIAKHRAEFPALFE